MKRNLIIVILSLLAAASLFAQNQQPQSRDVSTSTPNSVPTKKVISAAEQSAVDAQTKEQLKTIMAYLLEDIYVIPEKGKEIARQLRAKFESNAYKDAATSAQFAEMLTRDLRELGKDKHLNFRYDASAIESETILTTQEWDKQRPSVFPKQTNSPQVNNSPQLNARLAERLRQSNYEFREAKYLDGNIGYLNMGGFAPGKEARDAAAKTMALLADSDAMIIDLRVCPGGTGEMVSFLASYFFDKEPRVLMNRYIRPTDENIQSKTIADIPGKRMIDTDLYILVSSKTGSACESFPYTLQQYGRAKIVGEQTTGAGYNNVIIPVGKGFSFSVSFGRPLHPVSGKGWEAVGVKPDIVVNPQIALETAQKEALQKLINKTTDEKRKKELMTALQNVGSGSTAANTATLQSGLPNYVGKYGNKEISIQDGGLYYQRIGGRGAALRTTAKDKFALNADAQITFIRDSKGVVSEMLIEWVDRDKEQLKREMPASNQTITQSPNEKTLSQAEQEVRKLEREWLDAYEKRDAEAMNRIVADDFKLTFPDGAAQAKADILAQLKSEKNAGSPSPKLSTEDVQSRVEGDKVILTGRFIQQMERNGQSRMMQMRYTDTYAKREGRWQVINSQLTRIQPQ